MKQIKKTIKLSLLVMATLSSQSFAGGEFLPVSVYETEKVDVPIEIVKPKVIETVIKEVDPIVPKQLDWYAGVGFVAGQAKASNCEDKTYGVMARLGYEFSEYVGVEVRGFRTNWDYEGGKLKHVGAFLKPQYPVSKAFNVYGLAGYAKTAMGTKRSFSDTGLAYGFGLDYTLTNNLSIFTDYERLNHDAPYDLDALSLGIDFSF